MKKTTESESQYTNLEQMSVSTILTSINQEDQTIALAIKNVLPSIEKLVDVIVKRMALGGRLFYLGAGTSGRLGIVDASECPPTFGVEQGLIIGLIAGGDGAIRKAVEFAEDDIQQGWKDLLEYAVNEKDVVIGIAASGTTPYVIGALEACNKHHVTTACIVCNENSPVAAISAFPVEVVVGPEFITGSTRMKAGTAQKLVLNMVSTCTLIRLGRVKGNRMVDMQLSNNKLVDRGTKMVMEVLDISYEQANRLLLEKGSVRKAIESFGRK
jgi:N-acetylmuramic acid 6-phosphate etherase